jgi:polyhydroxyalkanoate synthesis regulator phasin
LLEELRRVAIVTSGVAELTRNRAEQVVKDLVKAGDVRKDQTSTLVRELLRRSAENRKELTNFVRSEIKHQIEGLGLASKRDVERLERRITRLEAGGKKKTTARKKTTAKKTTKKTPASGN